MKSNSKILVSITLALVLAFSMMPCAFAQADDVQVIVLSSEQTTDGIYTHAATLNGTLVPEYDYTWHVDPSTVHDEVKNSPAEFYTGTKPPDDEAVYIAHDIIYYPELELEDFVRVNYDGDAEWAYYYTAPGLEEYIFSTLPINGSDIPEDMMHSAEDAYQNAVLHITQPGTYRIEGEWHGQILIDLGDSDATYTDPTAKVDLILGGADVTCTVAPSLIFYSVYESDNTWEDQASASASVDTADAGANVTIADGTTNTFSGENVYRMLKPQYKSSDASAGSVQTQKKMWKQDGAFYSYESMNIDGGSEDTGVLNIYASYEGLDSELHLTFNGGNVNIYSQDDGINVNEDRVSVVTINGGTLHILAGLGSEGDGIDSNGYLVINGGTVISMASPRADSGLDSDCGSYVNGGTVVALGSAMDWAEADDSGDSGQAVMNLRFSGSQSADEAIIVTDLEDRVLFAYDPDKDEVAEGNARWYQGAVLSSASLQVGETCYVYVGGDVYGEETEGVYNTTTVTGFSDEAKQQCYTGTNVGGRPQPPEGFDPGQMGQPPEGFDPGQMGQPPEGFDPGQMGQPPEGFNPGQVGPGMPPGGTDQDTGTLTLEFVLKDKVNGFSGVRDYADADEPSPPAADTPEDDQYLTFSSDMLPLNGQLTVDAVASMLQVSSENVVLMKDSQPLAADAVIGTGTIAQVQMDGTEKRYEIVLQGDVLGTGRINISQLVRMAKDLNGTEPLTGAYLKAGDWTGTGKITISDMIREAELLKPAA